MDAPPCKVVAVIFPEFELLDLYGPLEIFGRLRDRVSITLVSEHGGLIASSQGPRAVSDGTMSSVDACDILVVPGGWGTRREVASEPFLEQLRVLARKAQLVTSVCTGSALLARAGILDGMRATSNKVAFDWAASQSTQVTWVREARWVEDGRFFTSSGISAGMDMALAVVQRRFDRTVSLEIARQAEYLWNDDRTFDPFAALPPQT